MGLKAQLDSLDGLDEKIQGLYTKTEDGKFKLDVEGLDTGDGLKSALQKEREIARDAQKRLKELQTQFEGIDPVAAKDLLSKVNQSEEARLIADGKIEEVIKQRTVRMQAEYDAKLKEAEGKMTAAEQRAARRDAQVLENQIRQAATEAGIHKHAIDDALLRARTQFSLSDSDAAVALGSDGQPVYGKDGQTPLSLKEWFDSMKNAAPHWYPAGSSGSGAGGGGNVNTSGLPARLSDCKTDDQRVAWVKANSKK